MAFLFQTRCPHCRARVKKREKTCPSCERWMDDHPDWNDARKWRRRATIGAAVFFAAVILIAILTRR
jgi:predicted amidophosphoribosyltransferase